MRGLKIGLLVGAIQGNKRKSKGYHQPGGILIYAGIPIVAFLCALNTYFWEEESDNPPHFIWLSPLMILLFAGVAIFVVAKVRKSLREDAIKEQELRKKRWIESFQTNRKH